MPVDISIVSPVYNEAGNIRLLYSAVARVIPRKYSWELILVDDGSTDGSREEIRGLVQQEKNVRSMFFSRNYGHQIALTAGLDHADGRAAITMDADLQHPPDALPEMLRLWEKGAEIVFAVRDESQYLSWFKRVTSRLFYSLLQAISHVDLVQGAADFRLMDRKVVLCLREYRERVRFLRGIIGDMGFRREVLLYREGVRQRGESKYDLMRMLRLALAGVVSFSSFPLRVCSVTGLVISLASFLYAGLIIYDKIVNGAPVGIASVLVGVFFIGGIQLIFIGVLGEYLMSVFKEVKARPLYCVSEKINM